MGKEAETKAQARPETRDVTLKIYGGKEERNIWALETLLTLYNPCFDLFLLKPMGILIFISRMRKEGSKRLSGKS